MKSTNVKTFIFFIIYRSALIDVETIIFFIVYYSTLINIKTIIFFIVYRSTLRFTSSSTIFNLNKLILIIIKR